MKKYILRLDDACEQRNIQMWDNVEKLLDKYGIKPLVGVIPHCEDASMDKYPIDEHFWERVKIWKEKNWCIAMHGYNHVYSTLCGGINPVNNRSEFAGETLKTQKKKITDGIQIFKSHGIYPKVFFAPSHTFDENTIEALLTCSDIRIISDTIANRPYSENGITFVPQQSGKVRNLPFNTVTFCYHPNEMKECDINELEAFLVKHKDDFVDFPIQEVSGHLSLFDRFLRFIYFAKRR